jgi:hypothetical protein
MDQTQEISRKIAQLISESPDGTMLGVRLGASLRAYFPNFRPITYGCRNLRHFLAKYVPEVSEKSRSGADVLYTVAQAAPLNRPTILENSAGAPNPMEPAYIRLPTSAYNWKAYSNPGHPFLLAANRETGMLRALPQDSVVAEPWVVVPKPTAEAHSEIAGEFAASLPEPHKTNLGALLHDPKWYVRFSNVAARNGLGLKWAAFRRAKLVSRFSDSLRALTIPLTPQPARTTGAPSWASSLTGPGAQTTISAASEESSFRDLVCKVISELPLSELRLLKLPVGSVFDALKR